MLSCKLPTCLVHGTSCCWGILLLGNCCGLGLRFGRGCYCCLGPGNLTGHEICNEAIKTEVCNRLLRHQKKLQHQNSQNTVLKSKDEETPAEANLPCQLRDPNRFFSALWALIEAISSGDIPCLMSSLAFFTGGSCQENITPKNSTGKHQTTLKTLKKNSLNVLHCTITTIMVLTIHCTLRN